MKMPKIPPKNFSWAAVVVVSILIAPGIAAFIMQMESRTIESTERASPERASPERASTDAAMQAYYEQGIFEPAKRRQLDPTYEHGGARTLSRRGDKREDRPERAVGLNRKLFLDYERAAWADEGVRPNDELIRCPNSCNQLLYVAQGDRVVCECGLHVELDGNVLYVWRKTPR